MLKGGSLGIYGDFFSPRRRNTDKAQSSRIMGPVIGLGESMFNPPRATSQALQGKGIPRWR